MFYMCSTQSLLFRLNEITKYFLYSGELPSVLWCCWLGSRKGIRPVKTEWLGAGVVIWLPLTVTCLSKIQTGFYRAMLCIRGTSHGPVSVRLSVRPSQVGVLLKLLNVGSHKQHHTIAQRLQFSEAKDIREIRPESTGAPNAGGWVKIGDFR